MSGVPANFNPKAFRIWRCMNTKCHLDNIKSNNFPDRVRNGVYSRTIPKKGRAPPKEGPYDIKKEPYDIKKESYDIKEGVDGIDVVVPSALSSGTVSNAFGISGEVAHHSECAVQIEYYVVL